MINAKVIRELREMEALARDLTNRIQALRIFREEIESVQQKYCKEEITAEEAHA